MEARKVIAIRNSLFVNIPQEICEGLKIQKGDTLKVGYLPSYGILITKEGHAGKIPVGLGSVDRMQAEAERIFSELKRNAKSFERSFVFNISTRMIGELVKSGLFDMRRKVEELQGKTEELEKEKNKLLRLVRGGKSTR